MPRAEFTQGAKAASVSLHYVGGPLCLFISPRTPVESSLWTSDDGVMAQTVPHVRPSPVPSPSLSRVLWARAPGQAVFEFRPSSVPGADGSQRRGGLPGAAPTEASVQWVWKTPSARLSCGEGLFISQGPWAMSEGREARVPLRAPPQRPGAGRACPVVSCAVTKGGGRVGGCHIAGTLFCLHGAWRYGQGEGEPSSWAPMQDTSSSR